MSDPAPTVEDFLRTLLRSRLMERAEVELAMRGVPRGLRADAQEVAEHFIKTGKLSRFQAGKLLKGVGVGLVLASYQILAPIGKGGMGTVYLARDGRSRHLVALKVLPPHKVRTEERTVARFRREMDLCQRVAHPHLAWTYEVGEYRGALYIAMEYIPGKTLTRLVGDGGPLPMARAARLMAEVASGLDHAHAQGLIHRDLKPSNILVTPHDHAKVLDLGLALIHGETGVDAAIVGGQGYIVGTMDYIAPEQTTDAAGVDRRSDVYSLGCTLYFALSGQPPFPGGTSREKVQRHRNEVPAPLGRLRPDLPPGFVAVVERMMAKRPDDRFATAAAAAKELQGWAAGDPPQPLDRPEEALFDERVLVLQAAGSSEFSAVSLPALEDGPDDVEELQRAAAPWPAWVVPVLSVGLGALAVVFLLAVLLLALGRR